MNPFLRQIANAYIDNEASQLIDYCFVLPNKRSAVFLTHHFAELASEKKITLVNPEVTTISDFVADNHDLVEFSRIELLFILYGIYREVLISCYHSNKNAELTDAEQARLNESIDFDKFQFWGDILISDFNDVDKYLVDPGQLFHNIETLKDISANYLTPEQIEVIKRYWNEDHIPAQASAFWNHITHTSDSEVGGNKRLGTANFVKLWQVLMPVYEKFRQYLTDNGGCYSGMAYRTLVDKIKATHGECLAHKRYIFVGFNVLSTSEHKIFELLRDYGKADFYWDYQSPTFKMKANRATRFLRNYIKEFQSKYDIGTTALTRYPHVRVISVPSQMGQVKMIGDIIDKLYPDPSAASFNKDTVKVSDLETAVVLPEESLAMPLMHSLPPEFDKVNVTMGYPLRHTPVAGLIRLIVSMQLRARKTRGTDVLFYEDVLNILSHPLIMQHHAEVCNRLIAHIRSNNLFNVPLDEFDNEPYAVLKPVFTVVYNHDEPNEVFGYIDNLLTYVDALLETESPDHRDEVDEDRSTPMQQAFVRKYRKALRDLIALSDRYLTGLGVYMADKTVFHLVERMIAAESVAFEGKPLYGLQVMGVLETRALDFDNIIMPSMNERIFPRKHYSKSFIPNALRRAYNMATLDHQESIFAYYFYRLISRAKNVWLLYDGRSYGTKNGQKSRYISQLEYLFPDLKIEKYVAGFNFNTLEDTKRIVIQKTPEIIDKLNLYRLDVPDKKYLSASLINSYISCPLQFYLTAVEGFSELSEVKDFMDEGTLGSVVHAALQGLYDDELNGRSSVLVTQDTINRLNNDSLIRRQLVRSVNEHFYHKGKDCYDVIPEDTNILVNIMTRMIKIVLSKEKVPFTYLYSEFKQSGRLQLAPDMTINYKHYIDRVDRITDKNGQEVYRLIDYKTGSDEISISSWDKAFEMQKSGSRAKAFVQLFLYCNGFKQLKPTQFQGAIMPMIYRLKKINISNLDPLSINKVPVCDYRDFNADFLQRISEVLSEMFDPNIPFTASESDKPCKYCQFTSFCNRDHK